MFIKSNFKCWKDFSRFKDVAENQQKYTVNGTLMTQTNRNSSTDIYFFKPSHELILRKTKHDSYANNGADVCAINFASNKQVRAHIAASVRE